MPRQQITSGRIGRPSGHFSQAIAVEASGRLVFISGMTSKRADGSIAGVGDIEVQTRQMCENVKAAVEAAGGTMADIIKMNVYLVAEVDASEVPKFRAVRDRYVNTAQPPASTFVVVSRLARPGWLIEIEAIAVI